MMATTLLYPYVTLNDVKYNCGIELSKDSYDEDIKRAINEASRVVDRLTGRKFYQQTLTDEYINNTVGGSEGWTVIKGLIFTPYETPIISITSLYEDDTLLVENTDFYINKISGIIQRASGCFNSTNRALKLSCVIGYASDNTTTPSDDIPGDIVFHAKEIASRLSGRYKKSIKNYVSGGAEEMDLHGIPKDSETYLKKYRPVQIL